ncbi:MAG: DUF4129 domain-containing protein [bacterium]
MDERPLAENAPPERTRPIFDWQRDILDPAFVFALSISLTVVFFKFVELIVPRNYLIPHIIPLMLLVMAESYFTTRITVYTDSAVIPFRIRELIMIFFAVKIFTLIHQGFIAIPPEFGKIKEGFVNFFDAAYIANVVIIYGAWLFTSSHAIDILKLGLVWSKCFPSGEMDEKEHNEWLEYNRGFFDHHRIFLSQARKLSLYALFMAIFVSIISYNAREKTLVPYVAGGIYFLTALLSVSMMYAMKLKIDWIAYKIESSPRIVFRWLGISAATIASFFAVSLLLPTNLVKIPISVLLNFLAFLANLLQPNISEAEQRELAMRILMRMQNRQMAYMIGYGRILNLAFLKWIFTAILVGAIVAYVLYPIIKGNYIEENLLTRIYIWARSYVLFVYHTLRRAWYAILIGLRFRRKPTAKEKATIEDMKRYFLREMRGKGRSREDWEQLTFILDIYLALLGLLERNGYKYRKGETPYEYCDKLMGKIVGQDDSLEYLTYCFVKKRYSTELLTPEEMEGVKYYWDKIREDLTPEEGSAPAFEE